MYNYTFTIIMNKISSKIKSIDVLYIFRNCSLYTIQVQLKPLTFVSQRMRQRVHRTVQSEQNNTLPAELEPIYTNHVTLLTCALSDFFFEENVSCKCRIEILLEFPLFLFLPSYRFFSGKKYVERISGFSMVFIFEILYIKATKNEYVSLHYNVYKNNIMSKIKCI